MPYQELTTQARNRPPNRGRSRESPFAGWAEFYATVNTHYEDATGSLRELHGGVRGQLGLGHSSPS